MKPIVKSMWIDSATIDLETFQPDEPNYFGMWVNLRVGPDDSSAADDYRLFVCSPKWLERECSSRTVVWGRHMLIVSEYDFHLIKSTIEQCVSGCHGENWTKIAQKVARYASWEFEDYDET